jgi:serine/threonine protein kinase
VKDQAAGRFRIVSQLGHGPLADVYLCRLVGVAGFEKDVVVKRIVDQHAADPHFVELFLEEARLSGRLTHPNIVEVFESGTEDGLPYIAMEYIRGVDLAQIVARAHQEGQGAPPYELMAALMAGVSDGLSYAHGVPDGEGGREGVIHRDVRPANILVSFEGVPKLMEFGMAAARGRLSRAHTGVFKESLRYMAPEQLAQSGHIDQRADVFGAGVTLYELTTGHNPFGAEGDAEVAVLDRVLSGVFPRPTELVPGYPEALEAIVLSALEPEVHSRCGSAGELRDRLRAFVEAGDLAADPRQVAGWIRRLFPDPTRPDPTPSPRGTERTSPSAPLPTARATRPFLQAQMGPRRPLPLTTPGRGFMWAALIALGVAAGAAILGLWMRAPASEPVSVSPALRQAARAYLEAAETLVKEKRYDGAQELLAKADRLDTHDLEVKSKLARLRRSIDEAVARGEPLHRFDPPAPPRVEALVAPVVAPPPPEAPPRVLPGRHKGRAREMSGDRRGRADRAKRKGDEAPPSSSATPADRASPFVAPSALPLVTSIVDAQHLGRVCQQVEEALAVRAGVPAEFARGVTVQFRQRVQPGMKIYPTAMYSFVVRQYAEKRDHATVGDALAAAQAEGSLR